MNSRKKWICSLLTTAFVCSCSSFGSVDGVKRIKKDGTLSQINSLFRPRESIAGLLGVRNFKGMGYKITDDMSLEVQTLLKFLSIISAQFSKCASEELNAFSVSFRSKRSENNARSRVEQLMEVVNRFCESEANTATLDIWYHALCRSACVEAEFYDYYENLPEEDKPVAAILFAYRKWNPDLGKWADRLKQAQEKVSGCRLSSQKLKSACQVEAKINRVAKSILGILGSQKRQQARANSWCPFKVFKIK